jgi:hypothetical protein
MLNNESEPPKGNRILRTIDADMERQVEDEIDNCDTSSFESFDLTSDPVGVNVFTFQRMNNPPGKAEIAKISSIFQQYKEKMLKYDANTSPNPKYTKV